jgi:hypothetical protein
MCPMCLQALLHNTAADYPNEVLVAQAGLLVGWCVAAAWQIHTFQVPPHSVACYDSMTVSIAMLLLLLLPGWSSVKVFSTVLLP